MRLLKLLFFFLLLLNAQSTPFAYANVEPNQNVVRSYIELIDKREWSGIPPLWVKNQSELLINFFTNEQNRNNRLGLFNIENAKLVALKQIPYDYGKNDMPTRYIEYFTAPEIYYVAVDYNVYREDKYHINGVNYFFIVTVLEDGKRKIALTPHVPVNQIISDGYGFGTADERTFFERRTKYK
ncbi:hypothetical protein [Paenibacillus sp. OV219]|uniref:hypothetical protein n=1 Tax=Paenibacillus sp. OV219 TaxID=1884377 RepID=UPI0008B456C9|nr:hypothetical protein [Paenibacillus sp. OV219]SEO95278.1 hypothetical protein SAMN05518847_11383 [Paenibacillus sp. OV219]